MLSKLRQWKVSLQLNPSPAKVWPILPVLCNFRSAWNLCLYTARFLLVLIALFTWTGCGKKNDLKPAVSELEKAFAISSPASVVPATELGIQARTQTPVGDANALVSLTLSSVASNDYAAGVIALQSVKRIPRDSARPARTMSSSR